MMEYLALGSGQNIMNAGVSSAMSQGFVDMKVSTLTMFNSILPIALAVLITIFVTLWGIAKFKELAGMTGGSTIRSLREHIEKNDPELWQEMVDNYESGDDSDE
jgi:Sec-independent protein translocase protein TatA